LVAHSRRDSNALLVQTCLIQPKPDGDFATIQNMGRGLRKFSSEHPFHITARCINREWFAIHIDDVWDLFVDRLYYIRMCYGVEIISFVLMPNHFHLLLRTPSGRMDKAMHSLMTEVSREIGSRAGRINQTFGGPYHSSMITCDHYLRHAYKYVYRNPVEAGICSSVESYRYSTLPGLLGKTNLFTPLAEDPFLFDDPTGSLKWLNKKYRRGVLQEIETALSYRVCRFSKDRKSRQPNPLEVELS
jgi:putative transposase